MAKLTVLDMVQSILSDLDSDEVNAIDDTVESQQVAERIRTTYFDMIGNRNWPHLKQTFQVDSSNDLTKPTHLQLPDNIKELTYFGYDIQRITDVRTRYEPIRYVEPQIFLRDTNPRNDNNDNVIIVEDEVDLLIFNDRPPTFWTSFNDRDMILDAFDNEVDDTIKTDKTQAIAYISPTFELVDDHVPDLPVEAFPALLSKAKTACFNILKQEFNQLENEESNRQQRWLSRKAWQAHAARIYPDYGRRSAKAQTRLRRTLFDKEPV